MASITRLLDPGARARGNLATVVKAEKVDDFTVDIVTKGPYPLLLNDLAGIYIMDKEWMEANDALQARQHRHRRHDGGLHERQSARARSRSSRYKPDVGTNLVVNPNWWDKPEHNLKRIEFKPDQVGRDPRRGAAVGRTRHDRAGAAAGSRDASASASGFKVIEEPSLRLIFLGAQLPARTEGDAGPEEPAPRPEGAPGACGTPSTSTPSRSASCAASRATPARSWRRRSPATPPRTTSSSPTIPNKAKKLLAEAGYPNGFKVKLNCPNDRYINDEQTCVAIAAMWTRVGIQADLQDRIPRHLLPASGPRRDSTSRCVGWATLPPMDGFSVLSSLLAAQKDGFGGSNSGTYANPKIEELTRQVGAGTRRDQAPRHAGRGAQDRA